MCRQTFLGFLSSRPSIDVSFFLCVCAFISMCHQVLRKHREEKLPPSCYDYVNLLGERPDERPKGCVNSCPVLSTWQLHVLDHGSVLTRPPRTVHSTRGSAAVSVRKLLVTDAFDCCTSDDRVRQKRHNSRLTPPTSHYPISFTPDYFLCLLR